VGQRGGYIKGQSRAERGLLARKRAQLLRSARVLLELEVGDGSDHWAPPGSDAESGAALSAAEAMKGARASVAGLRCLGRKPGTGPRREEGGRGRKQVAWGGKKKWADPESGEGEG